MDLIHEIACIWVDALDNDEIKDRKKASLFKILMERRIDDDDDDDDLEAEEGQKGRNAWNLFQPRSGANLGERVTNLLLNVGI